MPFNINNIESPTNKIKCVNVLYTCCHLPAGLFIVRMKKTATKATVEVCPGERIEGGFQLLVGLSEIHVPRMWVEEDDKGHHVSIAINGYCACMMYMYL